MVHAIFLMEQHIGHRTYYQNLRQFADLEQDFVNTWVPITYEHENRLLDLAPGLSDHVRGTLQGALQVHRALDPKSYDVAFFNTQVPAALAGRQVQRRPYVLATDITPMQYDAMSHMYGQRVDRPDPLTSYKHKVNLALMRGATRILPWSGWARDSLVQDYGVSPEQIDVIPPGVDLRLWKPGARRGAGPLRILFVGGDFYRKGGATLFKAFRALPKGTAELHLVTRVPITPEDDVHTYHMLQPNSPELIALYQSSDVFVLPTTAEAFGIAAIEASAVGLATITTAVGGLADTVEEGVTGFLIKPSDDAHLRAYLQRLADNPPLCAQMGWAARARAERCYDAQHNAARILGHLRAAAGAPALSES